MNARQFLNSSICKGAERWPIIRNTFYQFPRYLFPEFMKGVLRERNINNLFRFCILIYIIVFIPVFLIQAALAYKNGMFFPVTNGVKEFLEDYVNLVNYVILVEAYCISGCIFLYYCNNIDDLLKRTELTNHLELKPPDSSNIGSYLAILFVVLAALFGSAGYALEVQNHPNCWYVVDHTLLGISGYYYLYLNCLLLLFVSFIGVAHFSLFKTASSISRELRKIYNAKDTELLRPWGDEHNVRKWLAPFSTQILVSKLFVLSCILNLVSWKFGVPIGKMHAISVVVMIVIGMWIVTLPRYFVQYHIFRIRGKLEIMEYKDIRMPWIIGGSALIDMVLIAIIGKVLMQSNILMGFPGKILGG